MEPNESKAAADCGAPISELTTASLDDLCKEIGRRCDAVVIIAQVKFNATPDLVTIGRLTDTVGLATYAAATMEVRMAKHLDVVEG